MKFSLFFFSLVGISHTFSDISIASKRPNLSITSYIKNNMEQNIRTKTIPHVLDRNLNQDRNKNDPHHKFGKENMSNHSSNIKFNRNEQNQEVTKNVGTTKNMEESNLDIKLDQITKNTNNETIRNTQSTISNITNGTKIEETNQRNVRNLQAEDAIIINLEEINKMSVFEFLKRRLRSIWHGEGSKTIPQGSFLGRCIGIARKLNRLIPIVMIGMGVLLTKLAFLTLFSLKSLALLGLLVLMNVAAGAAKLGALFAAKKHDSKPQVMHFHVHPDVPDHHHVSEHYGPHGYWEDRSDFDISKLDKKDLYNLYDKLKSEEYRRQHYLYHS